MLTSPFTRTASPRRLVSTSMGSSFNKQRGLSISCASAATDCDWSRVNTDKWEPATVVVADWGEWLGVDRFVAPDRRACQKGPSAFRQALGGKDPTTMAGSSTKVIAGAISCQAVGGVMNARI